MNELGREKMLPLDHIKPYLSRVNAGHWSYPALSDSIVRWQQQVGRLPTPCAGDGTRGGGFNAVLIDRHGYFDRGEALLTELGVATSSGRGARRRSSGTSRSISAPSGKPTLHAIDCRASARRRTCRTPVLPELRTTTTSQVNLEWIGAAAAPFPRQPVGVVLWGILRRRMGGGRPTSAAAGDVDVVAGRYGLAAFYGVDRPDVADHLGCRAYVDSGFIVRLAGDEIVGGVHSLSLRILAADRSCYYQTAAVSIVVR